MKKAMSLLTATAMAATLLAGCGGEKKDDKKEEGGKHLVLPYNTDMIRTPV